MGVPSVPLKLGVAAGLLVLVARRPAVRFGLAALAVVPVLVFGPGAGTAWFAGLYGEGRDARFVAERAAAGPPGGRPRPGVFWSDAAYVGKIWFGVRGTSYISIQQMGGLLYYRETAIETRRRFDLVRPLVLDGMFAPDAPSAVAASANFLRGWYDLTDAEREAGVPPPTAADLRRVCEDPAIDWVVLSREFPEFGPATNGRVWVYDARAIRAAAGSVTPPPASSGPSSSE
jgi:hypothetical protein